MRDIAMKKTSANNDWWDWGIILLLVVCATLVMWAGVWVAHSGASQAGAVAAIVQPPGHSFSALVR
jgi:hypothetical protein